MYTLIAPAKINLYLEIIGDRPDGFHELVMIMQSIDLGDRLEIQPSNSTYHRLTCTDAQLGAKEDNLAYKAAVLMSQQFPDAFATHGGVAMRLDKRIPVAAGLAGGSADAAAVLVGINLLWNLGLTQGELQTVAAQLGSDIPFCVSGGTAIATGRGEQLDALPSPHQPLWIVLAKHKSLSVSTPWAYQTYRQKFGHTYVQDLADQADRARHIHSGPLVEAIAQSNTATLAAHLHNDLEAIVLPAHPQVAQLRQTFLDAGAIGAIMSGSGPSVFALCDSIEHAEQVKATTLATVNDPDLGCWITKLSNNGIHLATIA
ncbi:4-(cytidine 5'-diphospho)-2-C-methyl-D-erythritol kinase [Spirulina major]|uniref:4-(cytidine 5'-diphospho)-2-C-methyl-D-erythritol kinase n=1 Tax=Spirulina major TaxID=270636 RepID=UPI000935247D|nr:4-(cytidine 5'-diphospho)-2-C-methyl-D-erythritol kinase [Spirulina major]